MSHRRPTLGAFCTRHHAIPHLPEALSWENYALRNDLNGFNWEIKGYLSEDLYFYTMLLLSEFFH